MTPRGFFYLRRGHPEAVRPKDLKNMRRRQDAKDE